MADERLRIVLDALNKASDDIKTVRKDIGELSDTTKKADASSKSFGSSWAGVLTGLNSGIAIAQQVVQAVKKVYETAREGAELEYLQSRFDNLATSIDTTSRALLGDMRDATQGMYSDSELMASATDFMSLGLAKTHDEVVRLASVSGALNMNMNQLVLTLTNQTTMRFDALGVSVDGFDEKVKALEASGLSASEAFNEAFLQQAEEQIQRVGSAADESIGDFMRLEASFSNWAAVVKTDISTILSPAIKDLADKLGGAADFQNTLNDALESGIITQQEYTHYQGQVHKGYLDINEAIEIVNGKTDDYNLLIEQSAELTEDWALANDQGYAAAQKAATGTDDLSGSLVDANLAMQKYTESLLYKIASEGLGQEEALALAKAMGLVEEDTMYAATQVNFLRQRYDEGIISAEQYRDAVVALGGSIDGLHDKSVTVSVNLNDPSNVKGWRLQDQRVTYTVNTVRNENVRATRPTGGPVSANNPYLWQEYGYRGEMFVPSQNGYVLSRADAKRILQESGKGGGGATNNYYVTMPTTANQAEIISSLETLRVFNS